MSVSGDEDWAVISSSDYEEELGAQTKGPHIDLGGAGSDNSATTSSATDTENTIILKTPAATGDVPKSEIETEAPASEPAPDAPSWIPVWARRAIAWVHMCDKTIKMHSGSAFDTLFAHRLHRLRTTAESKQGRICGAGLSVLSALDSRKEYLFYYMISMAVCVAATAYSRQLAAGMCLKQPSGALAKPAAAGASGAGISSVTSGATARLQNWARETAKFHARTSDKVWCWVSRNLYEDGPTTGTSWFHRSQPTRRFILSRYADECGTWAKATWNTARSTELYQTAVDNYSHVLHSARAGAGNLGGVLAETAKATSTKAKALFGETKSLFRDANSALTKSTVHCAQVISEKSASLRDYLIKVAPSDAWVHRVSDFSQDKAAEGYHTLNGELQDKIRFLRAELTAWSTHLSSVAQNKHYVAEAKTSVVDALNTANRHFEATAISAYSVWKKIVGSATDH